MSDDPFPHDPTDSQTIPGDAPGSFEQAKEAVDQGDAEGIGIVVNRHDPFLIVEFGNVILNEPLPKSIKALLASLGATFTEATDNDNLRCIYNGQLPEELHGGDPVRVTLRVDDGDIPVRLFDSGWTPITCKHIDDTPEDVEQINSEALEKFLKSAGKI